VPKQQKAGSAEIERNDQIAAVGAAIRSLRSHRGLTLRELAGLTGFSIGFLSLVERGRSSISLTSLHTLARALEAEMSDFFEPSREDPEPPLVPHVMRAAGDGHLAIDRAHTYRLLGARGFNRALEPVLVKVAPCDEPEDAYAHEGEEFVYVLKGRLVIIVNGTEYALGPGDSVHYQSTVPHTYRNDTSEPVEALWVLTQRLF